MNQFLKGLGGEPVQLPDAMQIAERVLEEAEALGFSGTTEAMRQVLVEMGHIQCVPSATEPATIST